MNEERNQNIEPNEGGALTAEKTGVFRYGAMLPLAALATLGLTLSMANMIKTEFTPQDKAETESFEINPQVEEIQAFIPETRLDPLKEVEIPPAPPKLDVVKTANVTLPIRELAGEKIDFDPMDIELGLQDPVVAVDKEPTPLVRIPPVFPQRFLQGDVSGYCRVSFDISPEGLPVNVATTICTNARLDGPTVKSVQKWKYAPKIQNGLPVSRSGLQTTIRFDLQDENGRLLPLPAGY